MEVEQALRTLRLSLTSEARTIVLRLLHFTTLSHEVDGMFALQFLYGRDSHLIDCRTALGIGRHFYHTDFLTVPNAVGVRSVEHHTNLEGTVSAWSEVEVERSAVTFLRTLEGIHTLRRLVQSAETEIFEADDTTVGDARKVHTVVPHIEVVLHPLVAGHIGGDASRIILIWRQTENLETLRGDLSTRVFHAVAGFCGPFVVLGVWVVAHDAHLAAVSHGFLVPFNLHRSHHRLTGIAEATRRTMIEHIPLTVDFLKRAMGVVGCIGRHKLGAVLVRNHAT